MRMPGVAAKPAGNELEFIFRSLVDLKVKMEELSRRMDDQSTRHGEAIEVGTGATFHTAEPVTAIDLSDYSDVEDADVIETVLYKSGMTMADAEKAAIEGALQENSGNRRKAAVALGIGERDGWRRSHVFLQ